jgi:protein-L-isoaspartate(D-aspartate) O-methyltransferase
MIDFAQARRMMVDGQVRPSDVTDRDLLAAMLETPRERFVPEALASVAYLDRDIPIDPKRAMLKPMVLARLIQAAQVGAGDHVLDAACGSGYSSAILARLAGSVVALDDDATRVRRCGEILQGLDRQGPDAQGVGAANVTVVSGPLDAGWPALAPYDVILVNGAIEVEPHGLLGQLKDGGRLLTVLGAGPDGKAMLYRKDRGEIGSRTLFDAAAPVLPSFTRAPAFTF